MKRILLMLAFIGGCSPLFAQGLVPPTLTLTNKRPEAVEAITNQTFYKGETLLLTNCVIWSDSTGTVQNLSNQTVIVQIGDKAAWNTATGTVDNLTNGLFHALIGIPRIQADLAWMYVRVTNSQQRVTWPAKTIPVTDPLD